MANNKDNLNLAFKWLRKAGYYARQNIGDCQSCGWGEVPQDRQDKAVFYHNQDKEDLEDNGSCYLCWSGDGKEITGILAEARVHAEWDGKPETRIKITL